MAPNTPLYGAAVLQGICHSRHGTFPATYVRDINPYGEKVLGSPFEPEKVKMAMAKGDKSIGWGVPC